MARCLFFSIDLIWSNELHGCGNALFSLSLRLRLSLDVDVFFTVRADRIGWTGMLGTYQHLRRRLLGWLAQRNMELGGGVIIIASDQIGYVKRRPFVSLLLFEQARLKALDTFNLRNRWDERG